MNSISKYLASLSMQALLLAMLPASCVFAQESVEESVEQLADEIGEAIESWVEENDIEEIGEEFGDAIENWLKENSEELNAWSNEHGSRWEAWAERFEKKMSRWAKSQERDWDEWSKEYSDRLERWSRKLESDDLEADQLGELIEDNIKMLSDIPLGKLIDGALKQGLSQLEDAPWDSFDDLQSMIRRSIKQSVEKAEEMADRADKLNEERHGRTEQLRRDNQQENELEFLLPVDGQSQRDAKSRRSGIKSASDEKKSKLQELLNDKNTDWKDVEKIIAEMRKLKEDKQRDEVKRSAENSSANQRVERARAARKEAIERARQAAEDRLQGRGDQRQRQLDRGRQAKSADKSLEERRLEKLVNQFVKTQKENAASRESLQKIYQQLEMEKRKIDIKDEAIEEMKNQIQSLVKEIEKLKKNK